MPRYTARVGSGTLFNDISVLALTPDPVASFCLLSVEVMFRVQGGPGPGDNGGLLDVSLGSGGTSPSGVAVGKCDPGANGVNLVTPRFNYVTSPTRGTSIEKIVCPPRMTVYRSWEEGEFIVPPGGLSAPLTFHHLTGASMPASSSYLITVEWLE